MSFYNIYPNLLNTVPKILHFWPILKFSPEQLVKYLTEMIKTGLDQFTHTFDWLFR